MRKKLIDKDVLVAEIERRIKEVSQIREKASYEVGLYDAYKATLSFINTFEVKEVNPIDAFIEKAEDYFNSQLYDWVSITNPDQKSCENVIPKKDFIENFRNYMEGE